MWLHSLKVTQLLCSAACLHTNQSRSYLNHLVLLVYITVQLYMETVVHSSVDVYPKPGGVIYTDDIHRVIRTHAGSYCCIRSHTLGKFKMNQH